MFTAVGVWLTTHSSCRGVADNTLSKGSITNYISFMYYYIFMHGEMLPVRECFLVAKIIITQIVG